MNETPKGWTDWYRLIAEDFGYNVERDEESAAILAQYMENKPCLVPSLRESLMNRGIVVLAGASDSIDIEAAELSKLGHREKYLLFSADSATGALLEAGLVPDVVVTDMDGELSELLEAWRRGALMFIHAHGDNLQKLVNLSSLFDSRIDATCQTPPRGHIHNFGGFTDGDRAAFIAAGLGAKKIITIGMCLTCSVGQRSKKSKQATESWMRAKQKKLSYAQRLLTWLTLIRPEVEIIDATRNNYPPDGIKKKTLREALMHE